MSPKEINKRIFSSNNSFLLISKIFSVNWVSGLIGYKYIFTNTFKKRFAYVLTVLCNIQFTNFERAHRYYLTAIRHLGGIKLLMQKSTDSSQIVENRMESFVESMEMLLHEGLSQLYLVKQSPAECLSTVKI